MPTTRISLGGGSYDVRPGLLQDADGELLDVAVITNRDDAHNTRQRLPQRLAAALTHIAHPNVETLLQTEYPGHRGFCLVTPWPDGGDLRAYLAVNLAADVLAVARMIAQIVQHLHTSTPCIIHGNLDLSSVAMHGHTPRLWDFTLCRFDPAPDTGPLADHAQTSCDREGMIIAIAPELHSTGLVTPSSDVYAFGILLFELFARHRLFPSVPRLRAAILLYEGHRPSRNEFPSGPRGDSVWAIITRCWAQDPAQRPDMTQVETDLRLVS